MANNVELFQGDDKQWYFRIKAKNGLVVAQSEGYKDKRNAVKGIEAVEAAFAPPPPEPTDPDTPPIVAFAKRYSPLMTRWQAGISAVVAGRNEVTLMEILLRATNEGWQVIPPDGGSSEPVAITGQTPVVEKAPEPPAEKAPEKPAAKATTGRRRKASADA